MDLTALGPRVPRVLTMQADHRSSVLWDVQVSQRARLYNFHLIAYGRVDRALVTALVEGWRQNTHTFHLPLGEATFTLIDVVVLTRLPIEGHVVCTVGRQLESECIGLLPIDY